MSALTAAAFGTLLATCVQAGVPVDYYRGVVMQESSADPLALHQDIPGTPGRAFYPTTVDEAERIALGLMAQGFGVGIGLGQLTERTQAGFQRKFGLTIRQALADPCANVRAGSALLLRNWAAAISMYNCGGPDCAPNYVRQVLARITDGPAGDAAQDKQKQPDDPPEPYDLGAGDDSSLVTTYER